MNDEQLYTSTEVMRHLNISRATFNRFLANGKLPRRKVGREWRFFERDVKAVIRKVTP